MTRPSKKDMKLVTTIGQRLGSGEPLTQICRSLKICDNTVRNWMKEDKEVFEVIARAREEGEESIAFNLRQTARGLGESTLDVQRDKLIIDTDLKLLAKWNPKKYGDKLDVEHSGTVGIGDLLTKALKDL